MATFPRALHNARTLSSWGGEPLVLTGHKKKKVISFVVEVIIITRMYYVNFCVVR